MPFPVTFSTPGILATSTYPQEERFVSARADARAKTLESELSTTRKLDSVIYTIIHARATCPQVFNEFKQEILDAINGDLTQLVDKVNAKMAATQPPATSPPEDTPGVEKLIAFFRARSNAPASIDEMAKAISMSKVTVKMIVYKRHKAKFKKMPERGKKNAAYFRLAET